MYQYVTDAVFPLIPFLYILKLSGFRNVKKIAELRFIFFIIRIVFIRIFSYLYVFNKTIACSPYFG